MSTEHHQPSEAANTVNGQNGHSGSSSTDGANRADEIADRIASRVASFTSFVVRGALTAAAATREAAEDVWAEAQNIRRGKK